MSRIYWDTMLFIYWLEDNPRFGKRVGEIRSRMESRNDSLVTGAFTFGEVLAGVYSRASAELVREVKDALTQTVSEVIPFTLETADYYARIRGNLGVSPADAIHLASAAHSGTDMFITNDKRLLGKIVPGIHFIASLDTALI
jgi:predicted nucleic acid-binding protein